jgi:hypothetical protein
VVCKRVLLVLHWQYVLVLFVGQAGGGLHKLWFTYFLDRNNFLLLFGGGFLSFVFGLHLAWGSSESLVGLLGLILFFPLSIYLYYEARSVVRRFDETVSTENNALRNLFVDGNKSIDFIERTRRMIFSRKEYYLAIGVPIALLFLPSGPLWDFVIGKASFSSLSGMSRLEIFERSYGSLYWTLVLSVLFSLVWLILGITSSLHALGKEKGNLAVSRAIRQFRDAIRSPNKSDLGSQSFLSMDMSFGRLKEGVSPLANFVFILSTKIALVGFFSSIPALANYFLTGDFAVVWYGLCISTGILSFMVFTIGQLGISMIWNSSKDEALVIFEQLSDQVKFDCMNSIICSSSPPSKKDLEYRAHLEREASFMRTAIDDLRKLEACNFTLSAVARLFAAAVLPFLPLIAYKLLGL